MCIWTMSSCLGVPSDGVVFELDEIWIWECNEGMFNIYTNSWYDDNILMFMELETDIF